MNIRHTSVFCLFICCIVVMVSSVRVAMAQAATPFQMVGHIQEFTLDNLADPYSGGKMTVNGIEVVIPKFTIVLMPAAYLTPAKIFVGPDQSTQGLSPGISSGLALMDTPAPLAAFEATLDGNIVGGKYIAGLVRISQQSLNMSAGYIKNINTVTGELCVGATPTPVASCTKPDARLRINDPKGRYGIKTPATGTTPIRYPDERFSVDTDNPTIHALTGYPMCVPRNNSDSLCPASNRPADLTTFVMDAKSITVGLPAGHPPIAPCPACDPDKQAPFMVGDYINFQGTLAKDAHSTHPFYISAHTVVANVGIYTKPGSGNVAYITQEKSLLGTFGAPVEKCASEIECQARLKIEGFITDPTRAQNVGVYAIDVNQAGVRTTRKLAIAQKAQAPYGRFRFILGRGTVAALMPPGKGATREIMVRIDDPVSLIDGAIVPDKKNSPTLQKANGLIAGQYIAPVAEYIFPEAVFLGVPQPELNFRCLSFLTAGWGILDVDDPTSGSDQIGIGTLSPWPGSVTPPLQQTADYIDCTKL